jgi:hypothetical protein
MIVGSTDKMGFKLTAFGTGGVNWRSEDFGRRPREAGVASRCPPPPPALSPVGAKCSGVFFFVSRKLQIDVGNFKLNLRGFLNKHEGDHTTGKINILVIPGLDSKKSSTFSYNRICLHRSSASLPQKGESYV